MATLHFKIVTPEKTVYANDGVFQITLPTMSGEITILPGHIPLVSVLKAGELHLKDNQGETVLAVSGGFLEIRGQNEVILLADSADRAEQIDIDKAEAAHKRAAEEMIAAQNRQDFDFAKLQAVIDKEVNRIKVGKKYRKGTFKQMPSEDLASRTKK